MRLAEVIGALSLAADISSGFGSEKGLRTVLVATRLARIAGANAVDAFWVSALRFVGCTAFAPEEAALAAGDDISLRRALAPADFTRPLDVVRRIVTEVAPEASPLRRAESIARFFTSFDAPKKHAQAHCESAHFFATSLAMSEDVVRALDVAYERVDGKGPRGVAGDKLPLVARVCDVADATEILWWTGGADLVRDALPKRRGRTLDAAIVDAALAALPELVAGLREGSVWDAFLAAEGAEPRIAGDDIERGCTALGRFGDLKSRFTLAHSGRVAALAEAAAAAAGLGDADRSLVRRAAAVHDLGRVAIATGTWDKPGPLNAVEWQRVRAHSQHTEAILRAAGLDELAEVAGATHERDRGGGYHKGVKGDNVPFLAKLLAAADVMAALGETRPHRDAFEDDRAAKELRGLVESGSLDARAANAVLEARGAPKQRKRAWPDGLSDREVEVIRLVAVGRTNKEIGALLGVSPRTAQKHVMNIYDKLGLESRAGLALFAVDHGLIE